MNREIPMATNIAIQHALLNNDIDELQEQVRAVPIVRD